MGKLAKSLLIILFVGLPVNAQSIPPNLMEASVTVWSEHGVGSGSLVKVNNRMMVATAAHVVSAAHSLNNGSYNITVFRDVIENTVVKRRLSSKARVAYYSSIQNGIDAAILELQTPLDLGTSYVRVFKTAWPQPGKEVWHVGSYLGVYTGSVAFGRLAAYNRYVDSPTVGHRWVDQYDVTATKGSSGGAIYSMDGRLMGIVSMVANENQRIVLVVPIRSVLLWCKQEGISIE
jgi:S1-C subfamily serine protease